MVQKKAVEAETAGRTHCGNNEQTITKHRNFIIPEKHGYTFGLLRSSLKSRPHGVVRCSLVSAGTCVGIVFVGAACHVVTHAQASNSRRVSAFAEKVRGNDSSLVDKPDKINVAGTHRPDTLCTSE